MTESRASVGQTEYKYSGINPIITQDYLEHIASRDCKIKVIRLLPLAYVKKGLAPLTLMEIQRLAKALEKNISIHTLDFGNILETDEFTQDPIKRNKAIKAIAGILKKNTHIETIFLDGNPISSIGGFYLTEALNNSRLHHLSMIGCQFESINDIPQIIEALQESALLKLMTFAGSVSQKQLIKSPFRLLKLYEKNPHNLYFDKEISDFFERLILERKLIESRTRKTLPERELVDSRLPPIKGMVKHERRRIKVTSTHSMDPLPEVKEAKIELNMPSRLTLNRYSRHSALNLHSERKIEPKFDYQNKRGIK